MARYEILGRDEESIKAHDTKGCAYLGKIVTYPAGRYEEVGALWLDIAHPHCMLVLGKRGTGKSYTCGVLIEGFGLLEPQMRSRLAVVVIDTMGVFHGLKKPNTKQSEAKRLPEFNSLSPRGFDDSVRIFIPKAAIEKFRSEGTQIHHDSALHFALSQIEVHDWLSLFGVSATEPAGGLISHAIGRLRRTGKPFGFEEIFGEIEKSASAPELRLAVANMFRIVEASGLFGRDGTPYAEMVKGGQISVLDLSNLGQSGALDLRNLVVALIGRHLLNARMLRNTLEMQEEAGLVPRQKDAQPDPLVYMVVDEAHLFLPPGAGTLSGRVLIDWIKLGRHPGLSLILATQEPSALHETALRQADILIAHNITAQDDIDALGKTKQAFMTGSKDIQKIVSAMEWRRGLSVIFDDKTRKVEYCKVRPRLSLHTGTDATLLG